MQQNVVGKLMIRWFSKRNKILIYHKTSISKVDELAELVAILIEKHN